MLGVWSKTAGLKQETEQSVNLILKKEGKDEHFGKWPRPFSWEK